MPNDQPDTTDSTFEPGAPEPGSSGPGSSGPETDLELPRGLALAWGVQAMPNRGPKRELSIERIVEAGIEIADASGLDAVSMSAVAKTLGFTTMSLYRYVTAKDELIMLMNEDATGYPPTGIADAPTWQTALRAFFFATKEVLEAHPWTLDVQISGTPTTPHSLAWLDAGLSGLARSGLSVPERMGALISVMGLARWQAIIERGYGAAMEGAGTAPSDFARTEQLLLEHFVTEEDFPALAPVLATGYFAQDENAFAFGLDMLISGIEKHLAAGRAAGIDGGDANADPAAASAEDEGTAPDVATAFPKDPKVKARRIKRREAEKNLRLARKEVREAEKRLKEARAREIEAVDRAREKADRA